MLQAIKRSIGTRSPIRLGYHFARSLFAALRYGFPARNLSVIGITGSDGKTTTVGMTAHIMQHAGIATGALSTAFFQVQDSIEWNATQKTSPSPFVIQRFLLQLTKQHCTHAVLEYSSHGLVQGRTLCTWPATAAITNITMEHLDYHKTMDQYKTDKGKLFSMLQGQGTKVLNADDETCAEYEQIPSGSTITYSVTSPASPVDGAIHLWLTDITATPCASHGTLHTTESDATWAVSLPLPGSFNLENALCALACSYSVGISLDDGVKALESFTGTPGRMESIDEGQPFSVFVDFTVTPRAYEKTLSALRSMLGEHNRILVLTGSCGDRMKEKRPEVGRICSENADVVVVSNEDPYSEDPEQIIDQVWSGIDQSLTEAHRISDRKEAIAFLLDQAKPGDAVLLCGKGADTTMWVSDGQIPWNEREIVRTMLHGRS